MLSGEICASKDKPVRWTNINLGNPSTCKGKRDQLGNHNKAP